MIRMLMLVLAMYTMPARAEYGDVVFNRYAEKEGMPPVIYPHWFHRIRFTCNVCHHENGFIMRAGANDVTMEAIVEGKFCGMCHNDLNQVSWSLDRCDMCHSGLPGLPPGISLGTSAEPGGPR